MVEHTMVDVEQRDIYRRYRQLMSAGQRTGKINCGQLGAKYVEGVNDAFALIYGTMFTTLTDDPTHLRGDDGAIFIAKYEGSE